MTGFDHQFRTDEFNQRERMQGNAIRAQIDQNTGQVIGQAGRDVAQQFAQQRQLQAEMAVRDAEARLRLQEHEIKRQHHQDKMGTIAQMHQLKQQEISTRQMEFGLKVAEQEYEENRAKDKDKLSAFESMVELRGGMHTFWADGRVQDPDRPGHMKRDPAEAARLLAERAESPEMVKLDIEREELELKRRGLDPESRRLRDSARREEDSRFDRLKYLVEEGLGTKEQLKAWEAELASMARSETGGASPAQPEPAADLDVEAMLKSITPPGVDKYTTVPLEVMRNVASSMVRNRAELIATWRSGENPDRPTGMTDDQVLDEIKKILRSPTHPSHEAMIYAIQALNR